MYDPHLAPLVEAFLATHGTDHRRLNDPVPISTSHSHPSDPLFGKDTGVLRRRGRGQVRGEEGEEREGLLLADLDERKGPLRGDSREADRQQPSRLQGPDTSARRPLPARSSSDRPRPQDAEIRSVIFNHPLSPPQPTARSGAVGMMGAGGITLMPEIMPPPQRTSPHPTGPSTTFSFLSLSQASSPDVPTSMLDSMTSVLREDAREEVVSLPDTTSGYESAEAFSVVSSPRSQHRPPQSSCDHSAGPDSGLGLTTVSDVGMSYLSPSRTSRSVISLSESEGGSDWEALSEARGSA